MQNHFFYQCISVGKPFYQNDKSLFFEVTNNSDIPFYLINGVQMLHRNYPCRQFSDKNGH